MGVAVVALVVVALVVASCGGGEEEPTAVPPTATRPPAPAATQPPATPVAATPTPRPTLPPPPTATPAPSPTPVIQVKRGGILNLRLNNDPGALVLDSYDSAGGSSIAWMMPLMSSFVVENPYKPGEVTGDIATTWTVTQDGKLYTFKMRQDARFTDNKLITADDIAWNFTQGWKPPAANIGNTRSVWRFVTEIKAVDPATVQITLSQPSASFLNSLGQSSVLVYPRHVLGDSRDFSQFKKGPIGSGAYYRSDYKPAQSWHIRRNPAYYGRDAAGNQLPYLDGIDYAILPDFTAAQAAIRVGKIDLVTIFDASAVGAANRDAVARERNLQVFTGPGTRFDLLFRNKPPWNNKRIRQAISTGIDRKLLLDAVESSRGTILASPMVPPSQGGIWGLPESEMSRLPGFRQPHDAAFQEAIRILRAEGVREGTPLDYLVFVFFARGGETDAVVTELKRLGFNVKVTISQTGPEIIEKLSKGDYDINRQAAAVSFDDPTLSITPFLATGQNRNFGNWSFPKLDQLLEEQDRTLDFNKRREIIADLQRVILDELPLIPVIYGESWFGWPSYVKNHPKWVFAFGTQWRYDQVWLDR